MALQGNTRQFTSVWVYSTLQPFTGTKKTIKDYAGLYKKDQATASLSLKRKFKSFQNVVWQTKIAELKVLQISGTDLFGDHFCFSTLLISAMKCLILNPNV